MPLVRMKSKAQYSTNECSAREADDALKHAERIGTLVISITGEGSQVVGKLAQDLNDPTVKLEALVNSYDEILKRIGQGLFSIFANLDGNPSELESPEVRSSNSDR